MATERKKGGKGLARTEQVAIRFDPRTKYFLELCARVQRRTVTNFVEWAVEEAFKKVALAKEADQGLFVPLAEEAWALWSPRESERVMRLAFLYPHLLTYEEQQCVEVAKLILRLRGMNPDSVAEKELNEVEHFWSQIKAGVAENKDSQALASDIAQSPPTLAGINRAIEKHKKDLAWLEQKKAELEAANKNG